MDRFMRNKIILVFLFFLGYFYANSQIASSEINQEKYWYLRLRLKEQFVKIGLGAGASVPAAQITVGGYDNGSGNDVVYKKLDWGADATTHLGWYWGVLATEIHLLNNNGQNADETIQELYYALLAFDRLDDYAELVWDYCPSNSDCDDPNTSHTSNTHFDHPVVWNTGGGYWEPKMGSPYNSSNSRNGFFLRMDGHWSLINSFPEIDRVNAVLSRPYYDKDYFPSSLTHTYGGVEYSAWDNYDLGPIGGNRYSNAGYRWSNEPSQDQIFHLLMGAMLISEFANVSCYDPNLGLYVNLRSKAKEIGLRMLNYYNAWWILRNPITGKICNGGQNSAAFIPSLNVLKNYFTERDYKNHANIQGYLWGTINPETCDDDFGGYMVSRELYAVITAISNTTPHVDMCRYVDNRDGFDWGFYYLLRKALYPHNPKPGCDYTADEVRWDLELCPCRGPYSDEVQYTSDGSYLDANGDVNNYDATEQVTTGVGRPDEWFYSNRYLKACPQNKERGEFNGLDYMLLFNLAKIVYGNLSVDGAYHSMIHNDFSGNLAAGTSYTPVGFIDMESAAILTTTTRVEAKASKSITLLPGLFAPYGSYLLAEIDDEWTCNGITYQRTATDGPDNQTNSTRYTFESNLGIDSAENKVPEAVQEMDVAIYPNPTSGIVQFGCNGMEPLFVKITNANGVVLLDSKVSCNEFVSLESLSSGIYLVTISWYSSVSGQLQYKFEKIIKY